MLVVWRQKIQPNQAKSGHTRGKQTYWITQDDCVCVSWCVGYLVCRKCRMISMCDESFCKQKCLHMYICTPINVCVCVSVSAYSTMPGKYFLVSVIIIL